MITCGLRNAKSGCSCWIYCTSPTEASCSWQVKRKNKPKTQQLCCCSVSFCSPSMCLIIMLMPNWEWIVVTPIKNKRGGTHAAYQMWSVFSVFAVHSSLFTLICGDYTVNGQYVHLSVSFSAVSEEKSQHTNKPETPAVQNLKVAVCLNNGIHVENLPMHS